MKKIFTEKLIVSENWEGERCHRVTVEVIAHHCDKTRVLVIDVGCWCPACESAPEGLPQHRRRLLTEASETKGIRQAITLFDQYAEEAHHAAVDHGKPEKA